MGFLTRQNYRWDVIRPNSSIDFFFVPWYNTIRN
nr:MAG TPA: hypothetical protein [Caudoviricetes sp.]